MSNALDSPSTLDQYRLIAEIGRGGMAEVHLALSQGPNGFHKLVVLKRVRAHLVEDADARAMLLDEARLAGRLNHPNVVQTLEVAEHEGRPYIVMEYLEGQPFAAILSRCRKQDEPLSLSMSLLVICEALEGLSYLHDLKDFDGKPLQLVHRDISPQNLFVTYDGRIKVLDFGIAKAAISESETRAGVLKGKIAFMAPEQAMGHPVDARADIYAVGAVLWDIAAGQRLWKGTPEGHALYRTVQGDIPAPSSVNPDVDPRLEKICLKALAAEPADRYPDAPALLHDLESLVQSLGARPSARALGEFVGQVFGDVRSETEKIVAERVAEMSRKTPSQAPVPALAASGGWNRTASLPDLAASLDTQSAGQGTDPSGASAVLSVREQEPPPPRRMPGFIVAAVVAIVGVAGIALALQTGSNDHAPPADSTPTTLVSTAPVAAVTSNVEPKNDRVEPADKPSPLAITAEPKSALIFVDGREVEGRPVQVHFDDLRARHTVRIEAKGYDSKEFEVASGVQTSMHVSLISKSASPRSQPRKGPADDTSSTEAQPDEVATADVEAVEEPTPVAEPTPDTARDRIKSLDTSNPW